MISVIKNTNHVDFNRIFVAIAFAFPISLFAAFRVFGFDKDYYEYFLFFDRLDFSYSGRFELLFVFLSLAVKGVVDNLWALLFVVSFLGLYLKIYVLLRLNWALLLIICYLMMLFPLHEMTQLRVAIALGFFYVAMYYANDENRFVSGMFLFIVASLFQYTVLIFFIFILFPSIFRRFSFWLFALVSLVPAAIIYIFVDYLAFINPLVTTIVSSSEGVEFNLLSVRNAVFVFLLIIGLFNVRYIIPSRMPCFYISWLGLSMMLGLSGIPVFSHRLFELTMFSYFFWVSCFVGFWKYVSYSILFFFSCYSTYKFIFIDPIFGLF